jgi:hypothetical protein
MIIMQEQVPHWQMPLSSSLTLQSSPVLQQLRRCLVPSAVPPLPLQHACSYVLTFPPILSSNFQVLALLLHAQLLTNILWFSVRDSLRQPCPLPLPLPLLPPSVGQYLFLLMSHLVLMMLTGMRHGMMLCGRKFRPYALTELGPWCRFTLPWMLLVVGGCTRLNTDLMDREV